MRRRRQALGVAFAALLLAPLAARSEEDARMRSLEERVRALEDKLEASTATIEAQRQLLENQATPAVSQGAAPALDAFLTGLDVSGVVTGSYLYNFNSPAFHAGAQPLCQFNCRHDEFSFDAAMFNLGKAAAEPGQAGFQLDLLFGQNADILRDLSPTGGLALGALGDEDSDVNLFVQEAYASYNLSGVELRLGKWETLMGWEVLPSYLNYNVTHGVLFTWAIPLFHTGFRAGGTLGETGISWNLGLVDGFNNSIDTNDNKGFVGLVGYQGGPLFTSLSWFVGSEEPNLGISDNSTDDLTILDFVAKLDLGRAVLWANADWGKSEDTILLSGIGPAGEGLTDTDDSTYWGVALGTNLQFTEKLSFALRGEYWRDDDNVRGAEGILFADALATPFIRVEDADVKIYTLTGTLKYQLTSNAVVRGELRWDKADDDFLDGEIFPDGGPRVAPDVDDSSLLGIVEVSYVFD
jgi:hypothetical protein